MEKHPYSGVDTLTSALLDFGNGEAAIHCSTKTAAFQQVLVLGHRGRIEIPSPIVVPAGLTVNITIDDGAARSETFGPCDHYQLQVEAFADAILGGREWPFPLEDALANMAALDAVVRAAASGRWEMF
jgi:predicted dehydrogenase